MRARDRGPGDLQFLLGVGRRLEALDTKVDAAVQTRIRLHSRRLVERGTRWLLNNRPQPLELAEQVEFFAGRVEQVWSELPKLLRGADAEWYQHIHDELTAAGVPDEPATRGGRVLLGLRDAGHRRRWPTDMGEEPLGRRRGVLRPRRPARRHPADGPDQ